jgi:hypothetical protein
MHPSRDSIAASVESQPGVIATRLNEFDRGWRSVQRPKRIKSVDRHPSDEVQRLGAAHGVQAGYSRKAFSQFESETRRLAASF